MLKLGPRRADRIMSFVRRREIGDLTEYGLPEPEEGIFSRLMRLGVAPAIVDKEVIEAIKERRIEIVAGVESLDGAGVSLADGTRIEPEAVIAATGYRCGLEPVVGHLGVLDERGVPSPPNGDEAAPGLRFIGYLPRPAHIGLIAREASYAAEGDRGDALAGRAAAPPTLQPCGSTSSTTSATGTPTTAVRSGSPAIRSSTATRGATSLATLPSWPRAACGWPASPAPARITRRRWLRTRRARRPLGAAPRPGQPARPERDPGPSERRRRPGRLGARGAGRRAAPELDAGRPLAAVVLREQRRSPRDPRHGLTMLIASARDSS